MSSKSSKPLVGLVADCKDADGQYYHSVGDKYLRAVAVAADAVPFVIPALADLYDPADIASRLDGVCLTGSPSNVHPERYGQAPTPEAEPHDLHRDGTTLPLIREVIRQGVPLLAICRGFQELNVALGGTLHIRVHEVPGRMDHRAPESPDIDVRYGPRHPVRFVPGGHFERIAGTLEIMVNSLHWQGIDRLAPDLEVEGLAPDGTIEAVRVMAATGFALAVQWHPEYKAMENPFSVKLYRAFSDAVYTRAARPAT